jgi:hypothetical protein
MDKVDKVESQDKWVEVRKGQMDDWRYTGKVRDNVFLKHGDCIMNFRNKIILDFGFLR